MSDSVLDSPANWTSGNTTLCWNIQLEYYSHCPTNIEPEFKASGISVVHIYARGRIAGFYQTYSCINYTFFQLLSFYYVCYMGRVLDRRFS